MSGFAEKETPLDQKSRKKLLHLLSERGPVPPSAWSAFWQSVLGKEGGAAGEAENTLAGIFEDGLSFLSSRGLASEEAISRWLAQVGTAAEQLGVDRSAFIERLLTRQLSSQIGQRDSMRVPSLQTRDKILTAALEVFSSKGFHGATVDEIAERAELGKGTVYRHFSSKRELFSELIRSKVAELEDTVMGAINPEAEVLEIIETYLRIYFAFFDRNRDLYRVLTQEQSDFGAEVKALYIGNILKKLPLLKLKIRRAARSGRLKQMNFHTVFYGVMGFIDGVMQKWLASNGRYSLVDEVPTVLETIFYGFVNPGPTDGDIRDSRGNF